MAIRPAEAMLRRHWRRWRERQQRRRLRQAIERRLRGLGAPMIGPVTRAALVSFLYFYF